MNVRSLVLVPALAALLLAGCGDDDDGDSSPAETAEQGGSTPTSGGDGSSSTGANGEYTAQRGQDVRVSDAVASVHCDGGGDVYILADGAVITITGHCEDIEVTASAGGITAESADDVGLPGSGNVFSATEIGTLEIEGDDNTVTVLDAVTEIEIEGNNNTVTYGTGSPRIEDEGSGNQVSGR